MSYRCNDQPSRVGIIRDGKIEAGSPGGDEARGIGRVIQDADDEPVGLIIVGHLRIRQAVHIAQEGKNDESSCVERIFPALSEIRMAVLTVFTTYFGPAATLGSGGMAWRRWSR